MESTVVMATPADSDMAEDGQYYLRDLDKNKIRMHCHKWRREERRGMKEEEMRNYGGGTTNGILWVVF